MGRAWEARRRPSFDRSFDPVLPATAALRWSQESPTSETVEGDEDMSEARLEELPFDGCLALLRSRSVGRIAVVQHDFPVVVPVNFKLVETTGPPWVAIRTRPGNVIDRAPMPVALEIDGIDLTEHEGWSVLVRGTLHHVRPDTGGFAERFDPHPWMERDRDAWLIIEPFSITGRCLRSPQPEWCFHLAGYL
jgi:nitroimidazol reductase NimA-like FMN-containing flavoprotein (pyridoxamine 5'-phosphate oxidase superfamily)